MFATSYSTLRQSIRHGIIRCNDCGYLYLVNEEEVRYRHPSSGLWSIDGHKLTNEEARIFVDRAIESGYTIDEDVPEDKIREWIGLHKNESEVK